MALELQLGKPGKKSASNCKKECRAWKANLAERAGWNALRSLTQKSFKVNWAAALLDDPAWEDKLSKHIPEFLLQAGAPANTAHHAIDVEPGGPHVQIHAMASFFGLEFASLWPSGKTQQAPDGIALEALRLLL